MGGSRQDTPIRIDTREILITIQDILGSQRIMHRTVVVFVITLLCVRHSAGRKAKQGGGGGESEGQASCEETYIGGYMMNAASWKAQGGKPDEHQWVAYDFNSGDDFNETNPVMFDSLISSYCKPLPEEEWVLRGFKLQPGGVWMKLNEYHGKYNWEQWDKTSDRDVYSLPAIDNTCDDDNDNDMCSGIEKSWSCNITNADQLQMHLNQIQVVTADDCFTQPKCTGAPVGEQKCEGPYPIPTGKYATGFKIEVWGDRCRACSLGAELDDGNDGELCPRWFDVHRCKFEWELATQKPKWGEKFQFTLAVNADSRLFPSVFTCLTLMLFSFLYMRH